MRFARNATLVSLALVAGCTHPIHLGGVYEPRENRGTYASSNRETVATWDRWVFLWGFVDDAQPELQPRLDQALGSTQILTDVQVDESTTIVGWVLKFFTVGLVTQTKITVDGMRAVAPRGGEAPIRANPE